MTDPAATQQLQPLMTITEVAAILRVSRSTAFRMRRLQNWPCIKIGTQPRFDQDDLRAIIEMNREQPPQPKVVPNVGIRAERLKRRELPRI